METGGVSAFCQGANACGSIAPAGCPDGLAASHSGGLWPGMGPWFKAFGCGGVMHAPLLSPSPPCEKEKGKLVSSQRGLRAALWS